VATVISFLLPQKWGVDAIFEPSKFLIQTEGGDFRTRFFDNPEGIANYSNQGGYNNLIATTLSLNINDIPKLKAENPTNTNLVRFSIEEKDVEKAKSILNSLLQHLKKSYDQMADFKKKEIDSEIKSKETERSLLEEEIQVAKNKFNNIKQKKQEIEKEMSDIRKRIEELENERHLILNKKNRNDSDNLSIFLYSNEIHQTLISQSIQRGLLDNKKMEEEKINLEIKDKEIKIHRIENEINDLNETKKNIYYAQITKEPTSSISPVSPKKLTNVLIAGILGLLIFGMLAFFLEYVEKQKFKLKTKKSDI
jgi:capsular polysaccharide biosynthesis protein